jgi:protease IV
MPIRARFARTAPIAAVIAAAGAPAAFAQADRHYAEEPTAGINLPAAPLAGEADARGVATNPAGLAFAEAGELILAVDLVDEEEAAAAGPGIGGWATLWRGIGVGVEALRPPRTQLAPDPGTPTRFSLAYATPIRRDLAIGLAWRHFVDEGITDGLDTFDAGIAWRGGNYLAVGATARDLFAPKVAGAEVARRYELEISARPLGTDRLDVGLGGRVAESDGDVDGWIRASARVARGITFHAAVESRELSILDTTGAGTVESDGRDTRVTLGFELSFGKAGVAVYGAARRDEDGDTRPLGGTLVARWSSRGGPASILGHPDRIERIELSGSLSSREVVEAVMRLRAVVRDPGAKAVVVTLDSVSGGWASLEEVRNELLKVRAAKKKVFAYMVSGTGRDYYVATAADKIYVDPAGGIRLVGMAGSLLYYKGAFDMVGVDPQFEKIAEYKSAPESFTRTGPSDAAARMRNELYDSLWEHFVTAIATGRHLEESAVRDLIDNGPYTAGDLAKDKRLVDAVANPERVAELVAQELGGLPAVMGAAVERPDRWKLPAIAVIYAEGDIIDGKSATIPFINRRLVGAETMAAAIAGARADPDVDAIILRIDSPGGSAVGSELMAREVFKTRGVKPIVCSLGDVAASGGYFLAAGCDLIYAEPMSITGSIGIFYGKFDVSGLMDRLGVTSDTYKRGKRADMESMYRPYTDEERAVLLEKLEYLYGRFVGAVAEGRGMNKTAVDNVGRGHVWSGEQAGPIGLVDRMGGMGDALDEVKRQLGLGAGDRVQLLHLPRKGSSLLGKLLGAVLSAPEPDLGLGLGDLPAARAVLEAVPASLLYGGDVPQARLPFDVVESE